ncbi:MAG: Stp1/IreP family PP2C-type Ser/Thr phosphatase [Oscillospiraceae bacterium]|nr:Stp1/IreP family PP2C-type Ser/Thr phosphatase [Oscillospiraceae bacterium]
MRAWGVTDIGLRRRENQDTYAFTEFGFEDSPDTVVAVVCDGMGGVNGGQLASSTAVESFIREVHSRAFANMSEDQVREMETLCVQEANRAVYERSLEDPTLHGMGTTLVSAIVSPDSAVVCNVGDSRAYIIDDDGIRRVTRDHSVVESLVESGDITREEARTHPNRNLVTRALGPDKSVECDSFTVKIKSGNSILLCSDGLIVTVEDYELQNIISSEADGAEALNKLLVLALSRGAPDNVTAVLIRSEEEVTRQDG